MNVYTKTDGRCLHLPLSTKKKMSLTIPLPPWPLICLCHYSLHVFLVQEWIIYVDQSKSSLDRGGSATLDALVGLVPPNKVQIVPCILPKNTNNKKKAPWIRCISTTKGGSTNLDIGGVDSVDKCYRALTKHLKVKNVSVQTVECLKYKYMGNKLLESYKVGEAIEAYQKALNSCPKNNKKQQGVILLLRSSAYLQQAQSHKTILQKAVNEWKLPRSETLRAMMQDASSLSAVRGTTSVSLSFLQTLTNNAARQKAKLRKIQYRHGLYQNSLLQAAQDSLKATELLPTYSTAFLRAGEILNELWRIKESRQYYEKAAELLQKQQQHQQQRQTDDASRKEGNENTNAETPTASSNLDAVFRNLDLRQAILDEALSNQDWSTDSARLALDVAV
jgi:tetratricopeptide (TPR) repeat protein